MPLCHNNSTSPNLPSKLAPHSNGLHRSIPWGTHSSGHGGRPQRLERQRGQARLDGVGRVPGHRVRRGAVERRLLGPELGLEARRRLVHELLAVDGEAHGAGGPDGDGGHAAAAGGAGGGAVEEQAAHRGAVGGGGRRGRRGRRADGGYVPRQGLQPAEGRVVGGDVEGACGLRGERRARSVFYVM